MAAALRSIAPRRGLGQPGIKCQSYLCRPWANSSAHAAVVASRASASSLMEASMPTHFMTVPFEFEFVSQMQHATLQIADHQVIRRRMSQSFSDLLFEGFVPSLKISNMVRFQHVSLRICVRQTIRAGALREGKGITWERVSYVTRRRPLSCMKKPNPSSSSLLQGRQFQNGNRPMSLTWIRQHCCPFHLCLVG